MIYSKGTVATKEVAKEAVAETTDFLKGCELMDGADFTGTMLEQAMYISSLVEGAYTDLFTQIGIDELAVLESTGSMVVYEEAEEAKEGEDAKADKPKLTEAGKEIAGKVVDFFKKAWQAISTALTKLLTTLDTKAREAAGKFGKDVIDRWNKSKDKIEDGKTFGKIHPATTAENLEKAIAKIGDNAKSYASSLKTGGNSDTAEEVLEKVLAGTNVKGVSNIGELKSKFKEGYSLKAVVVTKADLTDNYIKGLLTAVSPKAGENGSYKAAIKAAYASQKAEINTIIAKIKNDKVEGYKDLVKKAKSCVSITNTAMSAALDLVRMQFVERLALLASINAACSRGESKAEAADKKAAKKDFKEMKKEHKKDGSQDPYSDVEATGESASLTESINDLFAW